MQHIKRWITALILTPVLLWVLIKGNTPAVSVMLSVVAVFSMHEYLSIIFGKSEGPVSRTIRIISYIMSIAIIFGAGLGSWQLLFLMLVLNFMALSVFVLARFKTRPAIFDTISKQVLGIVYIPVSLALLIFIREIEGGTLWIIWLLIVVFINDTGAFYSGSYLGKTPLAPNISPNKTVEGSIGGAAAAVVAGPVFSYIFFRDFSLAFLTVPGAFLLAVTGQVGDLFESAMKRASSIKDSGHILPGHGGMLDRIDGLLLAVPVLYVYLVFVL